MCLPLKSRSALLRLGGVYAFVAMFWALFEQIGSSWVLQAQKMDRVVFGIALALTVLQARGTLHPNDPTAALGALTLATGAAGAGAFLGAISTPSMTRRLGSVRWAALALIAGVGPAALVISVGTLPTLLMSAALVGFAGQSVKVCSDTIVQADIDDARRGRVFALYDVAVNISIVIGLTLCAFIAPSTGRSVVMAILMGVCGLFGAGWALWAQQRDPASRYAIDAAAISSEPGGDTTA